jgi:hypothetical protein
VPLVPVLVLVLVPAGTELTEPFQLFVHLVVGNIPIPNSTVSQQIEAQRELARVPSLRSARSINMICTLQSTVLRRAFRLSPKRW